MSAYLLFREQKEKSISKKFYGIFWVSHLWQRLEVNVSVYGAPGDCVFCPAMGKEGERKTRWEGGRETSSPSVVTPIKKWFFRFREISKFLRHPKKCLKNKNQMKKKEQIFCIRFTDTGNRNWNIIMSCVHWWQLGQRKKIMKRKIIMCLWEAEIQNDSDAIIIWIAGWPGAAGKSH